MITNKKPVRYTFELDIYDFSGSKQTRKIEEKIMKLIENLNVEKINKNLQVGVVTNWGNNTFELVQK